MIRVATGLLVALFTLGGTREADALITGGTGNAPIGDPGWPNGAASLFNHEGRVAWWEGPPFGGGQWHAECRGDAKALNAVLAGFVRLDAKTRRVLVHDGEGHSFWLAPNQEPEKRADARIDWALTVWVPANWERLRTLPADLNPIPPAETSPPAQLDIYTGRIDWAQVTVPEGVEVDDRRLVAHGFNADDGTVLEGDVIDLAAGRPIVANVRLQRVEPRKEGGYAYPVLAEAKADERGHWVVKRAPEGWLRVVVEAEGYVPRVAGYGRFDGQPRWESYETGLARASVVTGRVVDDAGKPLEEVEVSLGDVVPAAGGRYESPVEFTFPTDANGRFRAEPVPPGTATVWVRKPGYVRPGLGLPIAVPRDGVELAMIRSGRVRVTVDFGGKERPAGYIVSMSPEGGDVVGSYGGSGQIDAENRLTFEVVPPGRYVVHGQPNPSSGDQRSPAVTIDVKGGEMAEVTLKAR